MISRATKLFGQDMSFATETDPCNKESGTGARGKEEIQIRRPEVSLANTKLQPLFLPEVLGNILCAPCVWFVVARDETVSRSGDEGMPCVQHREDEIVVP